MARRTQKEMGANDSKLRHVRLYALIWLAGLELPIPCQQGRHQYVIRAGLKQTEKRGNSRQMDSAVDITKSSPVRVGCRSASGACGRWWAGMRSLAFDNAGVLRLLNNVLVHLNMMLSLRSRCAKLDRAAKRRA